LPADYHLDSEWSEVEKDLSHFPIAKPTDGWKTAERGLPSVVQGAAGERSRSTQFYYKKKRKLEEEESTKNHSLYGDISRFFQREPTSEGDRDHLLTFTPHFSPPLFEKEFDEENDMDMYKEEIIELEMWTKKNKPNGDWAKRVEGVRDLLILQQRSILKGDFGRVSWMEKSIIIFLFI